MITLKKKFKERLLTLKHLLLNDAKKKTGIKFNMVTFGVTKHVGRSEERDDWGDRLYIYPKVAPLNCNTTACAFGLAAISGKFKSAGLNYSIRDRGVFSFKFKGKEMSPFDIATKLFGIDYYDADYLFGGGTQYKRGAKAEREVAKRIDEVIETYS